MFVSRDHELSALDGYLEKALAGEGQVCFITGEAGFGKTSLALEFAHRACRRHPDITYAFGNCNAQSGAGDPFLPFREIFGVLTGDTDSEQPQDSTEGGGRLKRVMRASREILVELGPDLVELFLPGVVLATRAGKLIARRSDTQGLGAGAAPDTGRMQIFEQFTAVIRALSETGPLLLIVDDLQWSDPSSCDLLFHLARRIDTSPILIVGCLRPEDVDAGRSQEHHPLKPVLAEIRRERGDVFVALGDESDEEIKSFIDGLVDQQPNRLGDAFRRELARRTRGHPMFASELLHGMREHGGLVRDDDGCWIEGSELDWESIPTRVESVIAQRIERLPAALRELLDLAAVEGNVFTAQVLARLTGKDQRDVIRRLTHELGRQHRLVAEETVGRLGGTRRSLFRFSHALFQQHIYQSLGQSERELLHQEVGEALESIFGDHLDELAVELVGHFAKSRDYAKASAYCLQAGRRALAFHAHGEAVGLAEKGIALIEEARPGAEHGALGLELELLLGEALSRDGRVVESMRCFKATMDDAERLGNPEVMARAALGYNDPRWRLNLPDADALPLLGRALDALGDRDSLLRVRLLSNLARASAPVEPPDRIRDLLEEAVEMARRLEEPSALAEALRFCVTMDRDPRNIQGRRLIIDELTLLGRELGDTTMQLDTLGMKIWDAAAVGDRDTWNRCIAEHAELVGRVREPFFIYTNASMGVALAIQDGEFDRAERLAMETFESGRTLGVDNASGVLGIQMFTIRREQGRLGEVAPVLRHFLDEQGSDRAWAPALALVHAELGHEEAARAEYENLAADGFAGIPRDSLIETSLVYLADVCVRLGDRDRAPILYDLLEPYRDQAIVVGNAVASLGAASRFLGKLASLMGQWQMAEEYFRHAAALDERTGARPWLAHTHHEHASMLIAKGATGDEARIRYLLDQAGRTAAELKMAALDDQIRSLYAELGPERG